MLSKMVAACILIPLFLFGIYGKADHIYYKNEKIYSESKGAKMCFRKILYVNQTGNEHSVSVEHQVTLNLPQQDEQPLGDEEIKEHKAYYYHNEDGDVLLYDFEVLVEDSNSKHVLGRRVHNEYCEDGQFFVGIQYEWPAINRKQTVFRLTDDAAVLHYDPSEANQYFH